MGEASSSPSKWWEETGWGGMGRVLLAHSEQQEMGEDHQASAGISHRLCSLEVSPQLTILGAELISYPCSRGLDPTSGVTVQETLHLRLGSLVFTPRAELA